MGRRGWAAPAVLVFGFASLATLVVTTWVRDRVALQDFAELDAVAEIQRRVATSHLWLEEYVTGDDVPEEEIEGSLALAGQAIQAILDGGDVVGGRYRLAPIADLPARDRAVAVRGHFERFTELSRQRQRGYSVGADVGVGSELDVEYDRVFRRLLDEADELERAIAQRMAANRVRAARVLRGVVAAWSVLVVAAAAGLWLFERRRRLAETALAESERQLLQAQKMEAVGRLAGGIAHDINNYLAAITAQCERVQMKAAPGDPVAERMEEAVATAFKASDLIRRLLAFSRRQPVRREIVDLNAVIRGLEPMVERLLGDDVRLEARLAPDLWPIEFDPAQLEQVIVNLLVNAREAMPSGGRVTIDTANLRSGGEGGGAGDDLVVLAVADTGIGIPSGSLDKIFEPFFTTKAESGASGLGLATVYGVVTHHGGRIRVDSEPGRGTEFTLYMPRCYDAVGTARPAGEAGPPARGSEAVLVVEDNESLRESMASILTDLGYRVVAVATADEALEAFAKAAVDVVVSDVVMPDRSGPELVDRLRQLRPELPVLFISGTSGNLILRHGLRRGEFDLLEKPFTAATLARTLREILDRPR